MENNIRHNSKSDHTTQAVFNVTLLTSFTNEQRQFNDLVATVRNNSTVLVNDIIDELMQRTNLHNHSISYYDEDLNTFVYCGLIPMTVSVLVPVDLNKKTTPSLKLRARPNIKKETLMRMELVEEDTENIEESSENNFISVRSKRAKERKIGLIIQKVYMWRKLYNGFVDDKGNLTRLTLEEAADKVGISKKSLDDYLIQLRIGKNHGFNFNEHKNDKVGVLRAFVKKKKYLDETRNQLHGAVHNDMHHTHHS